MSLQTSFIMPERQTATIQISLSPALPISGWTIQWDLMYRFKSPNPIVSKYLASGYTNGESGCTLVDGSQGSFDVHLYPAEISGIAQGTMILCYQSYRIDSGYQTPINGGFRIMPCF